MIDLSLLRIRNTLVPDMPPPWQDNFAQPLRLYQHHSTSQIGWQNSLIPSALSVEANAEPSI